MEKVILNADVRMKDEKAKDIRKLKTVPGVVYGRHQEPISLKIDNSELLRTYRKAGESTIINLKIGKKDLEVVFHNIQREPISGDFQHIDFYAITRGEKLNTKISLNFIGDSEASKEGAIIEEMTKELDIKCLPKDLVEGFDIDLSLLKNIGDSIKVSDLKIDTEKYEILTNPEETIVVASEPAKIEVEETISEETEETEEENKEGETENKE